MEDDRVAEGLRSAGDLDAEREPGADGAGEFASETFCDEAGVFVFEALHEEVEADPELWAIISRSLSPSLTPGNSLTVQSIILMVVLELREVYLS